MLRSQLLHLILLAQHEITIVRHKMAVLGYPADGESNSVVSKAKSYFSCAAGKMA